MGWEKEGSGRARERRRGRAVCDKWRPALVALSRGAAAHSRPLCKKKHKQTNQETKRTTTNCVEGGQGVQKDETGEEKRGPGGGNARYEKGV